MFQQQSESEGVQPNHNNMPNSISEEPINRLPSNSGGSANQSQLFYMPNSSSEEPIHPLPSNLRGSSHQSKQFFEPKIELEEEEEEEAENEGLQPNSSSEEPINQLPSEPDQLSRPEIWTAERLNYYRPLFKAAQSGNWKTAKSFIDSDPNVLTAQISINFGTVLHIAAQCCQWKFVLMLLELDVLTPQSIAVQNAVGYTALHYVVEGGSLKTAKALVEKNANLLQMANCRGYLPLLCAIFSKNKELVWYLSKKTRVESPSPPFFIRELPMILRQLIQTGYHVVRVEIQNVYSLALQSITQDTVLGWFKRLLWKAITRLAPSIKIVRDAKMTHECANELVNHVVNQIELSNKSFSQIHLFLQDPIYCAIQGGIEEIVWTLLRNFPDLTFYTVQPQRNILQVAIECRQEKIVNILKEISPTNITALCSYEIENRSYTLHLAGKLAPAFKLFSVSGTAIQMQRELQWFKEVEMYSHPAIRTLRNSKNHTAKDVFRLEHKELSKDGEKWMKDTANSCMLVSTLIATVLFAAAFTVPGGNLNDKGIPIFLRSKAFTVFAISNALGLFSSLTSLLMFLAILTARYDIEDFLESLPKKLIIGLGSLFFAIAAMIIAFGAALTIILSERWHWVSVPITLLASFPVATFVMLQLPLFVQMVQSTYGASIFHPCPSRV